MSGNSTAESSRASSRTILLTDTNRYPSPARLAIGLAKLGCRIVAVCPQRGHPMLFTRSVERCFPYSALDPLGSLEKAINESNPDLVIPCDDRGVLHLHELYDRAKSQGTSGAAIAALIERSLGAPESYPVVSSRFQLLDIARQEGLRVPTTKLIQSPDDLGQWAAQEPFPWVMKADGTYGGLGVRVAEDLKQARSIFREMNRPHRARRVFKRIIVNRDPFFLRPWWNRVRPSVIAQRFIKGRPGNCAAFCWQGNLDAEISVEVLSSEGSTGPAGVVRVIDSPGMMNAAEVIARRLKLSGVFGLDFMIEEGTGDAYLIEMNPRSTPLCHFQLGKNRDLIAAIWARVSGQPLRDAPPVTLNDVIMYFPQLGNNHAEFKDISYYDAPKDEPELVRELLRPWPDRSLLYRLGHVLTTSISTQKISR